MTGCLLVGASYALLTTQTHAVGAVAAVGVEDSKVRALELLELMSGIHPEKWISIDPAAIVRSDESSPYRTWFVSLKKLRA